MGKHTISVSDFLDYSIRVLLASDGNSKRLHFLCDPISDVTYYQIYYYDGFYKRKLKFEKFSKAVKKYNSID